MREIHLTGEGFSGRGVRLRDMNPDEYDDAAVDAGKEAGENIVLFAQLRIRKCLYRIISAVTDKDVGVKEARDARKAAYDAKVAELQDEAKKAEAEGSEAVKTFAVKLVGLASEAGRIAAEDARSNALRTAKWTPVTALLLGVDNNPFYYGKIFGPKDHEVLAAYYRKFFSARNDEAELILGKALMVSEG